MSSEATFASLAVGLPAIVGGLLLGVPATRRVARPLGIAGALSALLLLAGLVAVEARGVAVAWAFSPTLQVAWRLDLAPLALALLVAGIGALILQFAGVYFGATDKGRRAIGVLSLFAASMLGLVLADDLLLLFVFWELTGLCSFFLINTDADKRDDTFASAQQALVVTVAGALPMLLGILYLLQETGTASLSALAALDLPLSVQTTAFALMLPGILTKSAQVPFHFWLPGAMAAPTPISAYLHSATMVKAGLIFVLYLFPICGGSPLWGTVLVPLGAATCVWGSYRALGEDDAKLLMAWSTVSQLGLIAITAGLGSALAIRAALLYLLAHAVFKAGLFLGIGAIDHATGTRKLSELGGLARRTPLLCAALALLAGSMAGLPPFAGFLSKELVLKKLLLGDTVLHDLAVVGIVLGSIGTVAYTARFFFGAFTGEPRSEGAASPRPISMGFLFPPLLLAILSLAGGVGARFTDRLLLEPMTASLLGYSLEAPELRLWHGINVPLILSMAILTLGALVHRFFGGFHFPPGPVLLHGAVLFERSLALTQALGTRCSRVLAGVRPSVYFALVLGLGLVWALPLVGALGGLTDTAWDRRGVAVLVMLAVSLVLVVGLRSKIGRILALTAVGFAVAMLFGRIHAPDLVLTQLLVEVLATVFFVAAVRFVADREATGGPRLGTQALRLGVAVSLGAVSAALVVSLRELRAPTTVSDYYFEAGPEIAQGLNLVNLVLGDFRALDTLIETLVVLLAGLGALAFLLGREVTPRRRSDA